MQALSVATSRTPFRILLLLILLSLAACKNDESTDFKDAVLINQYGITSITISAKNPIIRTGATQQYTAKGITTDGGSVDISQDVHWSVSDGTVARIEDNGLLTGLAQGDVSVTAQLSTYSDMKDLRVTDAPVSGITITDVDGGTDFTTNACETLKLKASASYSGEAQTADVTDTVPWSTGGVSTDIAYFSTRTGEQGWLLTNAVGDVIISATLDSASSSVTVSTSPGSGIILDKSTYVLTSTSDKTQAKATFDNTDVDVTRAAIWKTNAGDTFASVSNDPDSKGLISAHGVGPATISASCGNVTATASVTVESTSLTSVTIEPQDNPQTSAGGDLIYLNVGDPPLQLDAIANFSSGNPQNVTKDSGTKWEVYPDSTVVSVTSNGLLSVKATGFALVKVTYKGEEATLSIIVQ